MDKLPTYDQLKYYWCVKQGDKDLPCAMFVLECDAIDWVNQQSDGCYTIQAPLERITQEGLTMTEVVTYYSGNERIGE